MNSNHLNPLHPAACAPQLILRAINSSKSAFLAVSFGARFFDSYAVLNSNVVQAGILLKVRACSLHACSLENVVCRGSRNQGLGFGICSRSAGGHPPRGAPPCALTAPKSGRRKRGPSSQLQRPGPVVYRTLDQHPMNPYVPPCFPLHLACRAAERAGGVPQPLPLHRTSSLSPPAPPQTRPLTPGLETRHPSSPQKTPQSVLAAFRSQKVASMTFELAGDARLDVRILCDNGGPRQRRVGPSPEKWGVGAWGGSVAGPRLGLGFCVALARSPSAVYSSICLAQLAPAPPGLSKRYRLDVVDADILHASVDRGGFPTSVVAEAAELNRRVHLRYSDCSA